MSGMNEDTTRQFVIAVIDDIYKWMESISKSINSLNKSLDTLAENLLNQIVTISEDFQTIKDTVRQSRDTQFKTVFNMFSKNIEAIEEIREIALSRTESQKSLAQEFYQTLERLQKKVYYADFQTLVTELKNLSNELKSIDV